MKRRLLSTLLALCMMMSLLPTSALAVAETTEADIWDGSIAAGFESGNGTEADPYQISTAAQLAYLSSSVTSANNYSGEYFLQTMDLVLAGYEWSPISQFAGNYDGGEHTITGLTLTDASYDNRGLFGNIGSGASIKNLTLVNANVCGKNKVGGIVGSIFDNPSVKNVVNCHVKSSTISGTENVGGIAGYLWWANVEKSTVDCDTTVIGTTSIGGIVGYAVGTSSVSLCGNNAPVAGVDNVGGVVGYAQQGPSISQCYNTGSINGSKEAGGVCGKGYQNIKISNCYNIGEIRATSGGHVGGISASSYSNYGSTSCCYNYGNVYKGGALRNDLIVEDRLGSSMSNCYYLSQEAVSDGKGLTESQMADQRSFVGFDFQSVWVMNTVVNRPVLINLLEVPTTLYCDLVVLDATTYLPIDGVLVTEDGSWNTYLGWTNEDGTMTLFDSAEKFTSETTLFFKKEGYQPFICFYKDLDADSYKARPQNSIYMVPDNQDPGEDSNEQIFINEHISFIKNRYDKIISENDFYDIVWQYDEGKRLWAVHLWEVVGDIGEVVSLKFGDLMISADFYDLYLSDLILTLTNEQFSDRLLTKATNTYDKIYKNVTNNVVTNLITLCEKDELFRRDLEDIFNENSTINKTYEQIMADVGLLNGDLKKLLDGKAYKMDAATTVIYDKFFSRLKVDRSLCSSVFEGLEVADTIASLYTNALEFATDSLDAYILAKSCSEMNEELFGILFEAADEMASTNLWYAVKMKRNLNEYYSVATNETAFMLYLIKDASLNLADGLYNYFVKDALKDCTYKYISSKLNVGIPQLKALIGAYNGTYKFFNYITKNHEKGEQYCIMNYIAPFEKGLEAVVSAKGIATVSEQTNECAKKYDMAYSLLRYTNKYLYESAYNFATLTHNLNDQYYATAYKNAWNLAKCHNTVIADRSKYISVQCPVDVYLYRPGDDLVLSIVDDEVVLCNDETITVMVCNGEKSIMYPANTEYTIQIVSRTEGTMDYSIIEVEGIEPVRYVDFYDLPLRKDQRYTGSIPADFRIADVVYTLETDSDDLLCDYDSDATPKCDLNGHSYEEWITKIEPTIENFGLKERLCAVCGKIESSSIQPKEVATYTVVFNANGGTGTMADNLVTEGIAVTLPNCSFTPPADKIFDKWAIGSVDSNITIEAGSEYAFASDTTVYALWKDVPVVTYTLTLVNGTGSGNYAAGTQVSIVADAAPTGKVFDKWTTNNGGTFADASSANTTFTMPADDVTVTATYKDIVTPPVQTYTLTVTNGTGGGSYVAGRQVSITANAAPAGKVFDKWTSNNGGIFADASNASTTFTMPTGDVTVTATYKDIVTPPVQTYTLTVTNGTGGGSYVAGRQVSITANAAPAGKVFDKWTSNNGGIFADASSASTTFTMPASNVTITAAYKDVVIPPTPKHTHIWAAVWTTNATHHWHECTASGCDITDNSSKNGYSAHVYDNAADTTCNDCGFIRTVTPPTPEHTHIWAAAWTTNTTHHWHECTASGCDITDNSSKNGYSAHVYDNAADTTCNDCGYIRTVTPEHTHSWSAAWNSDTSHHWHECIAESCPITDNSAKSGYGTHVYDDSTDTTCNICGYTRTIVTPPDPSDWAETYYISVPQFTGGEIIPSTRNAERGERVTLTVRPDTGYELDSITVSTIRNREIALRSLGNERYSFTMPDSRVSVDASFIKAADNTPSIPSEDEPFTGLATPGISGIVLNPATMPFRDVSANNWYYNSVDYVWKHYLMSGVSDTQFAPELTTSRAMIWTILARMNNVRTDINPGSTWYEKGMLWAMERGVTDGSNPMGDITREQLATMLWRNAGSLSGTADLSQFSDSEDVSQYALTAVRWATANGILQGSAGKLNPKGTATRAQVAAMVQRYGEKVGR